MTTLPLRITAGVDTHLDVHVVAALDDTGALLGVESFETTTAGYRRLVAWLRGFGQLDLVGVEGTGLLWRWTDALAAERVDPCR